VYVYACGLTIELLDVFSTKQNVNLVLEFLDTDLEAVIRDKSLVFQNADIKSWLAMSLRGLEYIHRNGVLHRVCFSFIPDAKAYPAGSKTQQFVDSSKWRTQDSRFRSRKRVCGCRRQDDLSGHYQVSQSHATLANDRWYRPPELLFGSRFYSSAVDIWSMGTILVELVLRVPFLAGDTDADQLKKTFHALGTPTEEDWPVSLCKRKRTA
jgi:cyclin-dependent kinase 7